MKKLILGLSLLLGLVFADNIQVNFYATPVPTLNYGIANVSILGAKSTISANKGLTVDSKLVKFTGAEQVVTLGVNMPISSNNLSVSGSMGLYGNNKRNINLNGATGIIDLAAINAKTTSQSSLTILNNTICTLNTLRTEKVGNALYILYQSGAFMVYDVTDESNPKLYYSAPIWNAVSDFRIVKNKLIMWTKDIGRFSGWNLDNPLAPVFSMGFWYVKGMSVDKYKDTLYIKTDTANIYPLNINNDAWEAFTPLIVSDSYMVRVGDDNLYVLTTANKLNTYSLLPNVSSLMQGTNQTPIYIASCNVTSNITNFFVNNKIAYEFIGTQNGVLNTLNVVDVTIPNTPNTLYSLGGFGDMTSMNRFEMVFPYVYIPDYNNSRIIVLNIASPNLPIIEYTIPVSVSPNSVMISGRSMYVTGYNGYPIIYNLGTEISNLKSRFIETSKLDSTVINGFSIAAAHAELSEVYSNQVQTDVLKAKQGSFGLHVTDNKAVVYSHSNYFGSYSTIARNQTDVGYGGGWSNNGYWGDEYGQGAGYTYGAQYALGGQGGRAGGYFRGEDGYRWSGGGAGVVALGGGVANPGGGAQGGMGLYAKSGQASNQASPMPWAIWCDGGQMISGNVFIGKVPSFSFQTIPPEALTLRYNGKIAWTDQTETSTYQPPIDTALYRVATSTLQTSGNFNVLGNFNVNGLLTNTLNMGSVSNNSPLNITGNVDNYMQILVINKSASTNASTDLCLGNNISNGGNNNYIDLGINSSAYNQSDDSAIANDGYLYSSDSNLVIGAASQNKMVKIYAGGVTSKNIVMSISSGNVFITGNNQLIVSSANISMLNINTENIFGISTINQLIVNPSNIALQGIKIGNFRYGDYKDITGVSTVNITMNLTATNGTAYAKLYLHCPWGADPSYTSAFDISVFRSGGGSNGVIQTMNITAYYGNMGASPVTPSNIVLTGNYLTNPVITVYLTSGGYTKNLYFRNMGSVGIESFSVGQ